MNLSVVLVVMLLPVIKTLYICATPSDFDSKNSNLKKELIAQFKLENAENTMLHQLLFEKGTQVEKTEKDTKAGVKEAKEIGVGDRNMVIKKVVPDNNDKVPVIARQIEYFKLICDLSIDKVYNELQECKTKVIQGFYGCVEDGQTVFLFLEKLDMKPMGTAEFDAYSALPGPEKKEFMKNVISKFEKIHSKNIVHGNIQTTRLLVIGKDLKDVRIDDFSRAAYVNEANKGSFGYYSPPERSTGTPLSFDEDVYSLGITFGWLEKSFRDSYKDLPKDCKDPPSKPTKKCLHKFRKRIFEAFNVNNNNEKLVGAISFAIRKSFSKRFESMKEFSEGIETASQGKQIKEKKQDENPGFFARLKDRLIGKKDEDDNDDDDDDDDRRILASDSKMHGSGLLVNRILTDDFGSKILI